MTVCPRCGAKCAEGLRFCGVCGGSLPVQPVTGAAAVPGEVAGAVPGQVPAAPVRSVSGAPVPESSVPGVSVSGLMSSAAGAPGAARPGAVPGWAPAPVSTAAQVSAPAAMNPPAAWNPAATVPGGVQPARGAMDPRHAWLRGVRAPLVCMLVGAVVGVLYSPLAILIAAVTRNSTASGALVYGLVEGVAAVAAGLCTLMGIALLAPVAGDGRSGRGGVAMIAAFVLTAAYTGCMIARAEVRFRFLMSGNGRLVWNAIATVGGGLMSLVMIVLVMVMTRSGRPVPATGMAVPASAAQSMNMAKPYGSGARMVVLVACIVVVVCDLLVSVLYRGPLSTGGSVLESLYSAVNAIMFVLAVMLPLVALAGRLRETTGVNSRVAVLVVAVVCALAQVVSVCCTIGQLWLVGQSIEGKLSFDEYSDKYASLSFTNTVMSVVFYLTIVVAVVVMLVAVSKAARGVSGPARPVAYAPAPVAPVSMTPYASPAPQGGYNAPRNAPASQSGYGAGASDPSVPLPPAHSVQSPVAQTPQTRYPRR